MTLPESRMRSVEFSRQAIFKTRLSLFLTMIAHMPKWDAICSKSQVSADCLSPQSEEVETESA